MDEDKFLRRTALAVLTVFLSFILSLYLSGCGPKTILVPIPPKIDLQAYNVIGIVDFTSGSTYELDQFATQKFMSVVQKFQPNARFLELGPMERLLGATGRDRFDLETAKILGKKYNVDTVFTGSYEVSRLQPRIYVGANLSSVSASASVAISLTLKHWDTRNGATLWTHSRSGKWPVAGVRGGAAEGVSFRGSDPRDRYGAFMEQLIYAAAGDFRPQYERRVVAGK